MLFQRFNILYIKIFILFSKHQRKIKRGYLGFLCNISNKIICLSLEDVYIQDQINRSNV